MSDFDAELDRIRAEYARREASGDRDRYALHHEENLFYRHSQERALRAALARRTLLPLRGRRVLEVGCGEGRWFSTFLAFGVAPEELFGLELDEERLRACRERFPRAQLATGNAAELPWPAGSFDVVFQSALLSSILDSRLRSAVAAEMLRALRPGGVVISYDFAFDNPRNRSVLGIDRRELGRLFPGCSLDVRRASLAPPLVRFVAKRSFTATAVLESLRVLNTHLIATISPP